eukprot:TRINITY_DN479_c0_g1_i6.p1 TRINITY_DN479_c0_g1~~TRINITY_DN479_c0_g1_i6.p1  ORF type:complete len:372 (+),score=82.87 TRINITY_DN479_c0_g1_i6:86-1117(+)
MNKSQRIEIIGSIELFNDLPIKLMKTILEYLGIIDQTKCREVCKKWRAVIKKPAVLKFLYEIEDPWIKSSQRRIPITYEIKLNHPQLTINNRRKMVEWFADVQLSFTISERAYYLGVELLDRLLGSSANISKDDFQLFGIVCLWISSKYEDTHTRSIKDISDICDNSYSETDIMAAERSTLNILGWELYGATIFSLAEEYYDSLDFHQDIFCDFSSPYYSDLKSKFSEKMPAYINYLSSIAYYYSKYIKDFSKVKVASSIVFLSLHILELSTKWPNKFSSQFDIAYDDSILECTDLIFHLLLKYRSSIVFSDDNTNISSIFLKFSLPEYHNVSNIILPCDIHL